MQSRGWTVSWLGTDGGMENRLVPPTGIAMDLLAFSGLRGKRPAAHADRRLPSAQGLLGLGPHPAPPLGRRGAGHMGGYVCFPGGMMASLLGKPLMLVNCRRRAADEQQGLAAGGRPRGLRLRRPGGGQGETRPGHRQPGARRDRGHARSGPALRRPHRPAARAAGGRQPGRQGAERNPARRAGPFAAGGPAAHHPPDRPWPTWTMCAAAMPRWA